MISPSLQLPVLIIALALWVLTILTHVWSSSDSATVVLACAVDAR
jgi:hypothetical protein